MNKTTLDASGKSVGRVASRAAFILMGKATTAYAKNKVAPVKVEIVNASKASISDKKMLEKRFKQYSGYPGGFREITVAGMIEKKGHTEVFKKAVLRMIPSNRLRSEIIKNLSVKE